MEKAEIRNLLFSKIQKYIENLSKKLLRDVRYHEINSNRFIPSLYRGSRFLFFSTVLDRALVKITNQQSDLSETGYSFRFAMPSYPSAVFSTADSNAVDLIETWRRSFCKAHKRIRTQ